jgi:AcrR family transcriptional regulator
VAEPSRDRLLLAAKTLFAKRGYEQATTAAIARAAGTSESQLMRYFGSKSGLLEAIFNDYWSALHAGIKRAAEESEHSREALVRILTLVMKAFGRDPDLAFLILFEGRRVRGHGIALSKGFLDFYELVQGLIRKGQADGSFRPDISIEVLGSALLGCAEGMMRDRMMAGREGKAFDEAGIYRAFESVVEALGVRP